MAATTAFRCPNCAAEVPVDHGYLPWCEACGWNVKPPPPLREPGRVDRLYAAAGRRLGERLAAELIAVERLEPRLTVSKLLAYIVAAGVHLFVLTLVVVGVAILLLDWPNPFAIVGAVLLFSVAFLMRPRFGSRPKEGVVSRTEAPTLYALVDEVAAALDTPTADMIVITSDFNATWAIVGLRRTRVLGLGLSMFSILTPEERIALIGHELAHARNGDSTRGLFVGSALTGLETLYVLLTPDEALADTDLALFELPARIFSWLLSRPILGILVLEAHLLYREIQRAEYLADHLAARVAGTAAALSLEDKMLAFSTVQFVVERRAQQENRGEDLFAELRRAVDEVPARERERRRRVARLEDTRLDETHPPTAKRLELLERRPALEPLVHPDEDRNRAIDAEIGRVSPGVAHQLVEDVRSAMYG